MKRNRATAANRNLALALASEAPFARARVSHGQPEILLALLNDADVTLGQLLAGSAAVASLTADMVTRKDDSVKLACGDVRAAHAALVHSTKRVAYCARRRVRLTTKRADTSTELLLVTAKQLRVWGSTALARECVMEGVAAACALTSVRPLVSTPVVVGECVSILNCASALGGVLKVATPCGLRVVSAAGPGLHWFKPHSRNEFNVVLAQADGSAPVWLVAGDVALTVLASKVGASAGTSTATAAGAGSVLRGTVSLVYGGVHDDASEVVIQMSVGGVAVVDEDGDGDWAVRVLRRSLTSHSCAATGTHIRSLAVVNGYKSSMAVSADEMWLVLGLKDEGTLFVYSLPGCELVRSFGGAGEGPLQFKGLVRMCFALNGNLVVVDRDNKRLQEVTLGGAFVRFLGFEEVSDSEDEALPEAVNFKESGPECVAVHDALMAVGCSGGSITFPRVVLFEFETGDVVSGFGARDRPPHFLSGSCSGIRFTPDGSHLIVIEHCTRRFCLFTIAGVFVRSVGSGLLGRGDLDVVQSVTGEYVVADVKKNRVCVFAPEGSRLVRSWEVPEGLVSDFESDDEDRSSVPCALAVAGRHLYVMDEWAGRVQVFE